MTKAIYVVLIGVLLMAMGCGQAKDAPAQKQTEAPAPLRGDETSDPPEQADVFDSSKVELKGPGTLLKKEYGKWKMATEPRYFGPDNLYDLINGGAEIFVDYGFEQIVTTDYRDKGQPDKTITVEVYQMKTPRGAFGRISKYLENMANPKDAGKGMPESMEPYSIFGDGDLIFWRGRYIVHLTLMDEDPNATPDSIAKFSNKTMPPIGEAIFDGIEEAAPLEMLTIFPEDHMIPRSQGYHYDFEVGTIKARLYTARYKDGDASWTLFVTPPSTRGGGSNFVLFRTAKDLENFAELRSFDKYILGAQLDSVAKPDAQKLKKQMDSFQDALKKLVAQKDK